LTDPQSAAFGLDGEFTAAYLAVRRLADLAARDLPAVTAVEVAALSGLLTRNAHARRTQARILYREAAGILVALLAAGTPAQARAARQALTVALAVPGKPRLAAAEAVGGLPLTDIRAPHPPETRPDAAPASLAAVLARAGADPGQTPRRAGRSLVFPARHPGRLVVVKCLRHGEDPAGLALEGAWMERCAAMAFPVPCHVPAPCHDGAAMLWAIPGGVAAVPGCDPQGRCLAYVAREDYFRYPNDPSPGAFDGAALCAVLGRAARLLGWLAGQGVVHEAAIPLFHNRVQRDRREDGGVYDWRLPGRLDRWLTSALHPNFGASGLRDFEHLVCHDGASGRLYRRMGDHMISLFLVAGSAFRMRRPELVGRDARGAPVDARHLFDAAVLARAVAAIFSGYHEGFVGAPPAAPPFAPGELAQRMIEEMGVDRHMTELLRVADQEVMTDAAFVDFLVSRGMDPQAARALRRGVADVELETGPHLGDFNNRTSLPELNEAAAAAVATCLAARQGETF
jgi:hypothetical protein